MRIFQRLFSFWGKDMSNPEEGQQATGPGTYNSDAGISVADEDAMKLSAVWACTQIITDSVSGIPLNWYKVKDGERKELDRFHPIARLFRGKPNAYMKQRDFRRALTFQLALWNNAFAKIDYNSDGDPVSILPLHPARIVTHRDEFGVTYHYHGDKGVVVFSDKSILHLKGMGVEGVVGLNRSDFARNSYGVAASSDKYASKQFANGGKPSGVLKVDAFLTPEQREKLASIYEGITATADNAGKLWVLEGGTSYEKLAYDPNTMQMIESRLHQVGDIARFFGVPGVMVGAGDNQSSSWPASFENQQLSFLTFTLNSYLDEWEEALMDALLKDGEKGKIVCDHDEDDFVKMDATTKAEFLGSLRQNGYMTSNEGRKKLRLPEIEGGDELAIQQNMIPIQNLGESNGNENQPVNGM